MQSQALVLTAALVLITSTSPARAADTNKSHATSRDGTRIEYECAGAGPELLIVHGGTGDRRRWSPMAELLRRDFTVCAMDRRAHGNSGDGPAYSLTAEVDDVLAVVRSRTRPVTVLGHSFGAVIAYDAALRSKRIAGLILYEPPLRNPGHEPTLQRMETLIAAGDRDGATVLFMREIVHVSADELAAMRTRPTWPALVATIGASIRQDRALSSYRWDSSRARSLRIPVLLLLGSRTESHDLRAAIEGLAGTLPNHTLVVLEGQEHNAMDGDREHLAAVIRTFLQGR